MRRPLIALTITAAVWLVVVMWLPALTLAPAGSVGTSPTPRAPGRDAPTHRTPPSARPTPREPLPASAPVPAPPAAAQAPSRRTTTPPVAADAFEPPEPLEGASVWTLDVNGLRGAMAEATPFLEDCYEGALDRLPGLSGDIKVKAFIHDVDGVGAITEVIVDSNLHDDAMDDCVLDVTSRLAFDAPPASGLQITMPLTFTPGE